MKRYQEIVAFIPKWTATIGVGAVRSGRVVMLADLGMIAISVYQAWKAAPGLFSGGTPSALLVTGLLPGGVALGARVSLPSIAIVLEGIRKLVAIGALDAAIIGSVGLMGGDSSVALPELQRPTSLAVQNTQTKAGSTSPSMKGGRTGRSSPSPGGVNRPPYKINPARDPATGRLNPTKTPEPPDVVSVYEKAMVGPNGKWYARASNGEYYRFSPDNVGGAHFSGSTGGKNGLSINDIPIEIRRAFGRVK